ncbi:unknown [Lactococcus phage Q54]|uniref:Uncharacterized protein n=1 Tax=Lactococcus phage Q54 TaxID=382685 RepID=Q0GXS7_9CAUD|nr:hypothetical protein Q54_gp45 [Lactococcus phage Q54]ABF22599.1 unknown [Lactococcus phage Q54]
MKKVIFGFNNSFNIPVLEVFEFEDDATEQEINKEFEKWLFNELDISGIGGYYEEVKK